MTNPNNAVGTNAAYSGRTSPNALNDVLASYSRGIISGWTCTPKTGMTIQIGGTANVRDVAFAEDNAGNKLTINNRSGAPIEITLDGAPSTNNRIDAIVAYVDNPSTGDGNTTDNPTTCGIIAVKGTVAASPSAPSEATIRAAITTDGATGGSAYYVILATILVGTNVTTIGSGVITQGKGAVNEKIYPIGSIYMSVTHSTVAQVEAVLGGTWAAWGAGRVPVGVDTADSDFDTVEETGGEKAHILTVSEMPSHKHKAINWAAGYSGGSQAGFKTILEATNPSTQNVYSGQETGGDQPHNNLQPYITCYMYKRTA